MLYNRGYGSVEYRSVEDVLTIEFTKEAPVAAKPIAIARELPVPSIDGATPVDVVLTLPPMKNNKSEFQVNGVPFWKAKPYAAKLGEKQLWIVKNESDWDHPFHLHGFFFQVIDDKGAAGAAAGVEGHRQRADEDDGAVTGDVRRAARRMDVPLPHPRSRRRRADGDRAGRRRSRDEATATLRSRK